MLGRNFLLETVRNLCDINDPFCTHTLSLFMKKISKQMLYMQKNQGLSFRQIHWCLQHIKQLLRL